MVSAVLLECRPEQKHKIAKETTYTVLWNLLPNSGTFAITSGDTVVQNKKEALVD